jgi:hypothetical protein
LYCRLFRTTRLGNTHPCLGARRIDAGMMLAPTLTRTSPILQRSRFLRARCSCGQQQHGADRDQQSVLVHGFHSFCSLLGPFGLSRSRLPLNWEIVPFLRLRKQILREFESAMGPSRSSRYLPTRYLTLP